MNHVEKVKINSKGSTDINKDVVRLLDKMRKIETTDGVSRSKMIRILIREGYEKRFKK